MEGEPADAAGWLRRYELEGLEGLADRSPRSASRPHQMPAVVEAAVLVVAALAARART